VNSSLTRLHISAAGACRTCGLGLPKGCSRGHTHGAKMVAVPWAVYATAAEPNVLTAQVDRERIYNAPAFEYTRINEYATSAWMNNVYSYYGVSAQAGVSGGNFSNRPRHGRRNGSGSFSGTFSARSCHCVSASRSDADDHSIAGCYRSAIAETNCFPRSDPWRNTARIYAWSS